MGAPTIDEEQTDPSTKEIINGLNVEQMAATVASIEQTPELARFRFRATNQWINAGHNRSRIKGFYGAGQEDRSRPQSFIVDADEPAALMGEDHAPNPVEFVLHALAACLTTTLVFEATADGVEIDEIESRIEGELDLRGSLGLADDVRNGFEKIRVEFKVKSNAPREKLEELFVRAERLSSVFDIVANPVPVELKMEAA